MFKEIKILEKKLKIVIKKPLIYQINFLYGISLCNLRKIFFKFGLTLYTTLDHISFKLFEILINFLNYYGQSNTNIKNLEDNYLLVFQEINNYKGKRHRRGLPVRGQRTWSNAMNCRSKIFNSRIQNILNKANLNDKRS